MGEQSWLSLVQEEILQPDLRICDPHHHLWDRNGSRYLLDEILEDVYTGHRVVSTVFVECDSMFRADVTKALAPVGETEFVQGVAAMSSSGAYGDCRVAAGIVSFAGPDPWRAGAASARSTHCSFSESVPWYSPCRKLAYQSGYSDFSFRSGRAPDATG